ncbi:chlorhexidine efflux transporter [Rheinheimera sp.]|uniref:chlorhexidine efflux transporter n=1 Tax=Rheinheimera sp. TaxID=1869214 RepID=UPI003AF57260
MRRSHLDWFRHAICYELGAVGLRTLCTLAVAQIGLGVATGFSLLSTLTVFLLTLSHTRIFDYWLNRLTGSLQKSRRARIWHCLSYELTASLISIPLTLWLLGFSWQQALLRELLMFFAFTLYTYLFNLGYDKVFPTADAPQC